MNGIVFVVMRTVSSTDLNGVVQIHTRSIPFCWNLQEADLLPRRDWEATECGDVVEELPGNAPKSRGQGFVMSCYVDADHADDTIIWRSRTGFLNMAPVYWLSKKQNSVETSSFGSEFTAMKQCAEYIRGLRYKLGMMGIPCGDPSFIYGDNQSVLCNTSVPDSTLKKKSNSIAYHFVREGCARDEWRTASYVNTHSNSADLLTTPLPSGEKRMKFCLYVVVSSLSSPCLCIYSSRPISEHQHFVFSFLYRWYSYRYRLLSAKKQLLHFYKTGY